MTAKWFLFFVLFSSCSAVAQNDFEILIDYMTGAFSSQKQAETDSHFYDIRLHVVRIWPQRSDAAWLYVEQAAANALDAPYRQRIYKVRPRDDGKLQSDIFEIKRPLRFAGNWRHPEAFQSLTPDSLIERHGCAVILTRHPEGYFEGSTIDDQCISTHRGAAYATTDVKISATQMISWDRGFDDEGHQVWGSEHGGYIFDKLRSEP